MNEKPDFLSDLRPLQWSPGEASYLKPASLFIGKGTLAMEITVFHATKKPSDGEIRKVWKARKGKRSAPLVQVILYQGKASLCGAEGENPPIYPDMNIGQAERLCRELLAQPDRHAALRLLAQTGSSFRTSLPGLWNEGLLALHELEHGVPQRNDLQNARRKAQTTLGLQGTDLLEALGFSIETLDSLTSVLRSQDRRTALAVMLHENESMENKERRFNELSPVSYAFRKAESEDLPWIIFTQGNRIRLYATKMDVGVGRRGSTETYIECQPWLLSDEQLHYLWLLYSAEALTPGGSMEELLEGSERFAGELAKSLRERIYKRVVPTLAQGITHARGMEAPEAGDLSLTYEMALTVLFRLLFIAYAEDRDLLPYEQNEAYRVRSLKEKAKHLSDLIADGKAIAEGDSHWVETKKLWDHVAKGHAQWGLPAYGGALFSNDPEVSSAGAELDKITLLNDYFEDALRNLLVIQTREHIPGPVDFRSLGVREFGTIYEGLLESGLARADMDLALKKQKSGEVYVPAKEGEEPVVLAGEVYLHNQSGARKSTGSYYTKSFAVDHLLDRALRPALDDHFARLDTLDSVDASEAFFDFRVADIAMGSGHFLISAIDLMEQKMAVYLAIRRLSGVMNELQELRSVAGNRLGDVSEPIEDRQLLRRLIARRCIYGVDINPLAVQLARLAVWIHTFVPGLPLSFLDRTLIHGNSLVGMGSIPEIWDAFEKVSVPVFNRDRDTQRLLGPAERPLRRLANSNDTSLEDIAEARTAQEDVREAIQGTKTLCDLLASAPIGDESVIKEVLDEWEELSDALHANSPKMQKAVNAAREVLQPLSAVHFPIAFPEVFLRKQPGFDVILGNPPWEKVKVEEHAFWARHFPGFRGKSQREREIEKERLSRDRPDLVTLYEREFDETHHLRRVLVSGVYPGIGSGDPDLYKAFCWRFWRLSSTDGGYIGVVLPRSALAGKGSERFRQTMFAEAAGVDVVTMVNRMGWVFDEIHRSYIVALLCACHGKPEGKSIALRGPYTSLSEYREDQTQEAASFTLEEVKNWNDTVSLPLLPRADSAQVFAQLRRFPRLDLIGEGWRARPDRELDATGNKNLMDLESRDCPDGFWPVYKGESFDLWTPDTGIYYAWADPEPVLKFRQEKRQRGGKNRRSVHAEFSMEYLQDRETLPCTQTRIAFRDVTNSTDSRTIIACLLPPNIFLTHQVSYFLWPHGDEKDQAFLLGTLSSFPLDWYARRFVELHLSFFVINPFPIPRPSRDNVLWQRVVELSGRLACPDDRFAEWAKHVRVACGALDEDEKEDKIHELDAVVAHLYGLSESQLVHIFETFRKDWDYSPRLAGVLHHYHLWKAWQ